MIIEQWKEFFPEGELKLRYAISNHGRLKSFTDSIDKGKLLKGNSVNGYKVFRYRYKSPKGIKSKDLYIHRLVAENFIPNDEGHDFVIFLNHNKKVTHVSNLKWVNRNEMMHHNAQSPASKAGHESARIKNMKRNGHRLRENDVILLKRRLLTKKTRVKILAKRFNVSETTIYRIARNENWGHVSAY